MIKDFQSLLFSTKIDPILVKAKINELKNDIPVKIIDHQLILAFSLDYTKIPILLPLLSKHEIEENEFIHFDQELLFYLLVNKISFPISIFSNIKNRMIEQYLYEELKKQDKQEILKEITTEVRQKTRIENIIERDMIEEFRVLSNEKNFSFNQTIEKDNELYKYSTIPILLYCIEKKAIKCFKYALINGANPSQKSIYHEEEKWDGYGFAGAIGNIQIIKMIEDQGFEINEYVIKGSAKFHQYHIIQWIEKEYYSLLRKGMKNFIKYENYFGFDIIIKDDAINKNDSIIKFRDKYDQTLLHYASEFNRREIGEILISKGADINAKTIICQKIIILFLIKVI